MCMVTYQLVPFQGHARALTQLLQHPTTWNGGVGDGWAGWAIAHPGFGRSVNPWKIYRGWNGTVKYSYSKGGLISESFSILS